MMDLLNSDDSDADAHYIPDKHLLEELESSSEEEQTVKRRNKKRKMDNSKTDGMPVSINDFQKQKGPETGNGIQENNIQFENTLPLSNGCLATEGNTPDAHQEDCTDEGNNQILTKRGAVRKRGLKGESRKVRMERKKMRNSGQEYTTSKGKIVPAKQCVVLGPCRNKCSERVPENVVKQIFKEYWQTTDYNRRCSYIASCIEMESPKRRRVRNETENSHFRLVSVKYNIDFEGTKRSVCKGCFLKIIGESRRMVETVVQKKKAAPTGIIQADERGHCSKSTITEEQLTKAQEFLSSIPAYESHYSRRDCGKKFVAPHLTIASLYDEYKLSLGENSQPISYRKFTDVFHSLKLKIKKPKVDTCSKCDKIAMQIKVATGEEVASHKKELKDHHEEAEYAYESKRRDKERANIDESIATVTFDMQQCLPTPLIQNSVAFYKRQLWTFNLTIYDCTDGKTYCFLWHEGIAGRGANEVGSCVYKYIVEDIIAKVETLNLYSDTCGGQNKNTHIAAMYIVALQNSSLKVINHKFLIPGHTHMECDTAHAMIEKNKKRFHGNIEHPHDWAQLIRQTGKKHPFCVKEMAQTDFRNFALLLKGDLQQRKEDIAGSPFSWRYVQWLQFRKEEPGMIYFKTSLDPFQPFQCVSFNRRGSKGNITLTPNMRYNAPNPIAAKKKADLIDLFPFISPIFHAFYQNLKTSPEVRDVYPDDPGEEDASVEGNVQTNGKKKRRGNKKSSRTT